MKHAFVESTGDVFRDLGFSPGESLDLRLRSDLMIRLQEIVRDMRGSQAQIAARLDVTQPRVSDLLRGKISVFGLDALAKLLAKAGAEVNITVDDPALVTAEPMVTMAWAAASSAGRRFTFQSTSIEVSDTSLCPAA